MAKRKKKIKLEKTERPAKIATRTTQIRLREIAKKLGTTVPSLLESYNSPEEIIEKYDSGELTLLTEDA